MLGLPKRVYTSNYTAPSDSWVVHPLGRKTAELSQIGLRLEHKVKAMATTAVPSIEQQLAPSTFGMHEFAHSLLANASVPPSPPAK